MSHMLMPHVLGMTKHQFETPEDIYKYFQVDLNKGVQYITDVRQQYETQSPFIPLPVKDNEDDSLPTPEVIPLPLEPEPIPVEEVADFVKPQHKPFVSLLNSLYTECRIAHYKGWALECSISNVHIGVWRNRQLNKFFIGCRGTSLGGTHGTEDIIDDLTLTFGFQKVTQWVLSRFLPSYVVENIAGIDADLKKLPAYKNSVAKTVFGEDACFQLWITYYGRQVVQDLIDRGISPGSMIIAGHSLGGRAAACLATMYGMSECVLFNPAAPLTNPLTVGIGKDRQFVYHICGDLISSHCSEETMTVLRIDNSSYTNFYARYGQKVKFKNKPSMKKEDFLAFDPWDVERKRKTAQDTPSDYMSVGPENMYLGKGVQLLNTYDSLRYYDPRTPDWQTVHITKRWAFNLYSSHIMENFTKRKPYSDFIEASYYDAALVWWSNSYEDPSIGVVNGASGGLFGFIFAYFVWSNPVPGSQRGNFYSFLSENCVTVSINFWTSWNCWMLEIWRLGVDVILYEALSLLGGLPALIYLFLGLYLADYTEHKARFWSEDTQ